MCRVALSQSFARRCFANPLTNSNSLHPSLYLIIDDHSVELEDMRREVIEQEQQQRREREQQAAQPAADPANAEEMDNASFLASLAPNLRQEILLSADDAFIASLPPNLIAEANVLRERVASQARRRAEEANAAAAAAGVAPARGGIAAGSRLAQPSERQGRSSRQKNGKLRVESDRKDIVYTPDRAEEMGPFLTANSAKALLSLFYLISPIQPARIHKLMLNMFHCKESRVFYLNSFSALLTNDRCGLLETLKTVDETNKTDLTDFPPSALIGSTTAALNEDRNQGPSIGMLRRRSDNRSVAVASSLPASARGSSHDDGSVPPIVSRRIVSTLASLCKSSPRVAFSMLDNTEDEGLSCLEKVSLLYLNFLGIVDIAMYCANHFPL